jgi:hypothetical protein
MSRKMIALGGIVSAIILAPPNLLAAAELLSPAQAARAYQDCGPCGCMSVTYVHHRDMQSTYGLGFDPRNYDQTEPHFYFGRMHAYPRYFVDGVPAPGSC